MSKLNVELEIGVQVYEKGETPDGSTILFHEAFDKLNKEIAVTVNTKLKGRD